MSTSGRSRRFYSSHTLWRRVFGCKRSTTANKQVWKLLSHTPYAYGHAILRVQARSKPVALFGANPITRWTESSYGWSLGGAAHEGALSEWAEDIDEHSGGLGWCWGNERKSISLTLSSTGHLVNSENNTIIIYCFYLIDITIQLRSRRTNEAD